MELILIFDVPWPLPSHDEIHVDAHFWFPRLYYLEVVMARMFMVSQ
jgi:hypothetical protein